MTNVQATEVISVLLLGNIPTEKSYTYQAQQVTSNSNLALTPPCKNTNTAELLNSYFSTKLPSLKDTAFCLLMDEFHHSNPK